MSRRASIVAWCALGLSWSSLIVVRPTTDGVVIAALLHGVAFGLICFALRTAGKGHRLHGVTPFLVGMLVPLILLLIWGLRIRFVLP